MLLPLHVKQEVEKRLQVLIGQRSIFQADYDAAVEVWNRHFNPVTIVNGEPSATYSVPSFATPDDLPPGFPIWEGLVLINGVGGYNSVPAASEDIMKCMFAVIDDYSTPVSGQPIAQP